MVEARMERTRGGAVRPQPVLTARDVELVAWLARFGYATTPILCRRFGSSYKQMRWRIARLVRLKMLREERLYRPWIVLPTADGMELAASPLSVPSLSLVRIRHTLGIAQLGCEAELAGSKVWPEREIRLTDRGRRRLALSVHVPDKDKTRRAAWHVPDLVIAHPSPSGGPPLLEAVELELTSKSARRLHDILTAYAASPLFSRVTYYTCSRSITVAVEDAAFAISLHPRELIRVRPYPGEDYTDADFTRGLADVLDARAIRWTPGS
jgi:hypothetical protein